MPRKGRFGYDPDNTSADGHYIVGKGKPPEHCKFRKGDGRPRGRRPKGTRNLATDFREELDSSVAVTVGGIPRKVSRQRAIVMRLADNATKGQNSAIALALELQQRLVDPLVQHEELKRKRELDLRCLTDTELEIMIYLSAKVENVDGEPTKVIGVIPIYREGHYLSDQERAELLAGFRAYGFEAEELGTFPPKGRLISQAAPQLADSDGANADGSEELEG